MGKFEKILEIVSLIFGVFYYICEYATKKTYESTEGKTDVHKAEVEECSASNEEICTTEHSAS
jgi:hypothetical protein